MTGSVVVEEDAPVPTPTPTPEATATPTPDGDRDRDAHGDADSGRGGAIAAAAAPVRDGTPAAAPRAWARLDRPVAASRSTGCGAGSCG